MSEKLDDYVVHVLEIRNIYGEQIDKLKAAKTKAILELVYKYGDLIGRKSMYAALGNIEESRNAFKEAGMVLARIEEQLNG